MALTDVRVPIFAVGTAHDHIAPWRSTYKIYLLADTEVTYLLASGGHNAGIELPPGRDGRSYQVMTARAGREDYRDPDSWQAQAPQHEGSRWPQWVGWLAARSGATVPPPRLGLPADEPVPLGEAPGSYVLQA